MNTPATLLAGRLAGYSLEDSPSGGNAITIPDFELRHARHNTNNPGSATSAQGWIRAGETKVPAVPRDLWHPEIADEYKTMASGKMRSGGRCRTLSFVARADSPVHGGSPAVERKASTGSLGRLGSSCSTSSVGRLSVHSGSVSSTDDSLLAFSEHLMPAEEEVSRRRPAARGEARARSKSLVSRRSTRLPRSVSDDADADVFDLVRRPLSASFRAESPEPARFAHLEPAPRSVSCDPSLACPPYGSPLSAAAGGAAADPDGDEDDDDAPCDSGVVDGLEEPDFMIVEGRSPCCAPPEAAAAAAEPSTPARGGLCRPDAGIGGELPDDVELIEDGPDVRGDLLSKCALPTTGEYHRFDKMIRQISPDTVHGLLSGAFKDRVDQFLVIDCRFPFEFEGGHIAGARNYWQAERAIHHLFVEPEVCLGNDGRTALIFYCEFSSHRAPTMLRNIRLLDEAITAAAPGLLLPELYILEGGYSTYFGEYAEDCTPGSYRKMKDKAFADQNITCESIMRQGWEVASDYANFKDRPAIARLASTVAESGVVALRLEDWLSGLQTPVPNSRIASPRTPQCQVLGGPA